MRPRAPFYADDLEELDERLLSTASDVIPMRDVVAGNRSPNVIGFRHDCDNFMSLWTATKMAKWESERDYRSTYFILHTARYWGAPGFAKALNQIAECGHEIGIHVDALAESFVTKQDPDVILDTALDQLRALGHEVVGAAGHGNALCNRMAADGESWFANDEQFTECRREDYGAADRIVSRGDVSRRVSPRPLADFGLEYEALFCALPFHFRFSDSGGHWINPGFNDTVEKFGAQVDVTDLPNHGLSPCQLHLLVHPDWWGDAFVPIRAAA